MGKNMIMDDLITFSEIIDKLMTVNIKLFNLLDKTSELDRKTPKTPDDINMIVRLSGENIRLVRLRSELKTALDRKLNDAIRKGGTKILDEVKNYDK